MKVGRFCRLLRIASGEGIGQSSFSSFVITQQQMHPSTTSSALTMVANPVGGEEDYSVARIGWVEGVIARPDQEAMSQLTARMEAQFTAILKDPEPTERAMLPDLDLLFSAGDPVSAFSQIKHKLETADGEVAETEQDTLISQTKTGLLTLHSKIYGSEFEATQQGGDGEGKNGERRTDGGSRDGNGCEGAWELA